MPDRNLTEITLYWRINLHTLYLDNIGCYIVVGLYDESFRTDISLDKNTVLKDTILSFYYVKWSSIPQCGSSLLMYRYENKYWNFLEFVFLILNIIFHDIYQKQITVSAYTHLNNIIDECKINNYVEGTYIGVWLWMMIHNVVLKDVILGFDFGWWCIM